MQLKRSETVLVLVPVLLALVAGYLQVATWSDRIGWDTVSYLEIAEAFRTGRMDLALNPYWSPLYPLLYAIVSTFFPAVPERVSLSIFQYGCFLFFILTSAYLWKTVLAAHHHSCSERSVTPLRPFALYFYAACVTIFSALVVGDLTIKSPDMLAAALFTLANGLVLSGVVKRPGLVWLIVSGVFMGLAYLAKAFFISWIIPFLALLFWQRKRYQIGISGFSAIAISTLLVVACYAVPLSLKLGYPTIGESGKYQFVFSQVGETPPMIPLVHGTHEASQLITQQPKHPTRVFFENPRVFEFAEPFDVSYPPWFDPHYWNEGFKINFDWNSFMAMMPDKIMMVINYIGILSVFMMCCFGIVNRSIFPFSMEQIKQFSPMVVPSKLCILLLLATVIWPRYMIGLVPMLFAGMLLVCRYPDTESGIKNSSRILVVTSVLMFCVFLLNSLFHLYFALPGLEPILTKSTGVSFPKKPFVPDPQNATAAMLKQLGIQPKDRVARVSLKQDGEFYWTRLANIRVVCESVDAENFFKSPVERREELYKKLHDFGVKAIILDWSCRMPKQGPVPTEEGWVQVPETSNYIRVLR